MRLRQGTEAKTEESVSELIALWRRAVKKPQNISARANILCPCCAAPCLHLRYKSKHILVPLQLVSPAIDQHSASLHPVRLSLAGQHIEQAGLAGTCSSRDSQGRRCNLAPDYTKQRRSSIAMQPKGNQVASQRAARFILKVKASNHPL